MAAGQENADRCVRQQGPSAGRRGLSWRRRLVYLTGVYGTVLTACIVAAEAGFRLFWNPKYWMHTGRMLVGSGQTEAGKKWWPDTKYLVESREFRAEFHTNSKGYRAGRQRLPEPGRYRVAFVGDSFTEGMQVAYESTFCARLEALLEPANFARTLVCENFGVSATDLLEYWHRIHHDVVAANPPDAIVLCVYPGNDFRGELPDRAFDESGKPLANYYQRPGVIQHVIAWVNLHSKFGCYAQRALLSIGGARAPGKDQAPKNWWADAAAAARSAEVPAVRRSRAILAAIDEECRRRGIKLCVLVVGPVADYVAANGESPLGRIISSWGLDIPVIDIAIKARAMPNRRALTFPFDGHLTERGHEFVAREAAGALQDLLVSRRGRSTRR